MSQESRVTFADKVFQGEDKQIQFDVVNAAGTPINLVSGGYTLAWFLFTQAGPSGSTLITKAHASFTFSNGAGTNDRATVAIADIDTIAADGSVTVAAGTYWHELWKVNEGDEQMLAFGDFVLRPSRRRQQIA